MTAAQVTRHVPAAAGIPRGRLGLAALASAAFVYVTAETLPIGLLPQLSAGLHVHEGAVGLLVTVYAAVAGLTAIPFTAVLEHRPRRQVIVGCVALLAVSQLIIAVAPDYAVVLGARVICALAHGVFWSVLAPVAARLVAPDRAGRATAVVFTGNSLALILGVPLGTALGHAVGWRTGMAAVGVVAVLSCVALRLVLPRLPPAAAAGDFRARIGAIPAALRSRALLAVCVITVLVATAQFTAYTYITDLVRRDAGLQGTGLTAVLFAYGAAGIAGIWLTGRSTDRRPRRTATACAGSLAAALAGLAVLAHGSVLVTVLAIALWGGAFTAIPVVLQAAVLRAAPRSADTASALYVVAFQIGIGGGALAGSLLVDAGLLAVVPVAAAVLAAAGAAVVLAARRTFPGRPGQHPRPR
jgi:predicted MFS family arabinose efflux permease